jgi:outer membrane protein TolC
MTRHTKHGALLAGLVVLLATVPPIASAGELDASSTIEDYLRIAAQNHPGLRASLERWKATEASVQAETGWPDPVLSWGWYIEPVQTAVGPQEHRIGLTQNVPWFGTVSTGEDAARERARSAEEDHRATRLRLFERVGNAYYEYAYLAEALRVTGESLALLGQQESVARARYRTQSTSYADLIKAQVEQGVLEDRLRSLEERRRAAAASLNEALGRELQAPLPWPVPLDPPGWTPPAADDVRERIGADNPELQSLEHRIEATNLKAEVQTRRGRPDFQLGIQTILTGESELTSFEGQGKDAWIATFAVSLPLWRGQYAGARDEARASARMLEFESRETRGRLGVDAERLLFELRDAERKAELYGTGLLPKASQALEATARAFQTGDASFLDYLDAQRTLLMFQLDRARARADYGQKVLALARIVGAPAVETGPVDPSVDPVEESR